MKLRNKKRVLILLAVLLLAIIIPVPYGVDDGGSRGLRAVIWETRFWHNNAEHNGIAGHETGTTVMFLGFEIWNDWPRSFVPNET